MEVTEVTEVLEVTEFLEASITKSAKSRSLLTRALSCSGGRMKMENIISG